jgi:hypothetical protein
VIVEPASDPQGQLSFELQQDSAPSSMWPRPVSVEAVPVPVTLDGYDSAEADVTATAMLDRVIQRIFAAGLLLQAEDGNECAVTGAEPAVGELRDALNDIRATVLSWTTASIDPGSHLLNDEFGATIAHLGAASRTLKQLLAGFADGADGISFAAINDADRIVSCALIVLLDAHGQATSYS